MAPPYLVQALLRQVSADGSRSSALKPLGAILAMLLPACVVGSYLGAPTWLMISLLVMIVAVVVLYLAAYVFLLVRDRDALRSETYSLQKLAIERGLVGDDRTGLFEIEEGADLKLIREAAGPENAAE